MTGAARFEWFVILAGMRTGSNYLESHLMAMPGVTSYGEAFNPAFPGFPNATTLCGLTLDERDTDPLKALDAIRRTTGAMPGFRYFADHDPRVFAAFMDDPRCAKIVLTRNPLDSYISRRIAQETGQWKLTNVQKRKSQRVRFDAKGFARHLDDTQAFQSRVLRRLQETGQTAFHIRYDDLGDLAVLNGLAAWLGLETRLDRLRPTLKRQNPEPALDKVENPEDMLQALAALDPFAVSQIPDHDPRRGPAIPAFVAAFGAPVLFMPIRSGPEGVVARWLADLDGVQTEDLRRGFTQRSLRDWMVAHPGHVRFAVVRHPVARAHEVFCRHILPPDTSLGRVRRVLERRHDMVLPDHPDLDAHRAAFLAFLRFVRANLAGQTVLPTEPHWASQSACLAGMATFCVPHRIIREDRLEIELAQVADAAGCRAPQRVTSAQHSGPHDVAQVWTADIEYAARAAYARDYEQFGFPDFPVYAA